MISRRGSRRGDKNWSGDKGGWHHSGSLVRDVLAPARKRDLTLYSTPSCIVSFAQVTISTTSRPRDASTCQRPDRTLAICLSLFNKPSVKVNYSIYQYMLVYANSLTVANNVHHLGRGPSHADIQFDIWKCCASQRQWSI